MERFHLPAGHARELCARLGLDLPADLGDVAELYRRWCARVPFDPVAKALALREGRTPPGAEPVELCERWLATGVGATCWGHVATLAGVLGAAGVEGRVALDRLVTDDVVDFHAFLVVEGDGAPLGLDPIHPSGAPLPLVPGAEGSHPGYRTGVDLDGDRLAHWFENPPDPGVRRPYALLSTSLDPADVRAFCQVAAVHSGVRARRFFHRCAPPGGFEQTGPAEGGTALVRRRWDGAGVVEERLDDPDEAVAALGYGPGALALVERAGLLEVGPAGPRWVT